MCLSPVQMEICICVHVTTVGSSMWMYAFVCLLSLCSLVLVCWCAYIVCWIRALCAVRMYDSCARSCLFAERVWWACPQNIVSSSTWFRHWTFLGSNNPSCFPTFQASFRFRAPIQTRKNWRSSWSSKGLSHLPRYELDLLLFRMTLLVRHAHYLPSFFAILCVEFFFRASWRVFLVLCVLLWW